MGRRSDYGSWSALPREAFTPTRKEPFEVRIRFDPAEDLGVTREQKQKAARQGLIVEGRDPDAPSPTHGMAMIMNLSQMPVPQVIMRHAALFPDQAVKKEFGADWGITWRAGFPIQDADFAGSFEYYQVFQVHQNGVGTYTVFQLFNSTEDLQRLRLGAFHVVKFRR